MDDSQQQMPIEQLMQPGVAEATMTPMPVAANVPMPQPQPNAPMPQPQPNVPMPPPAVPLAPASEFAIQDPAKAAAVAQNMGLLSPEAQQVPMINIADLSQPVAEAATTPSREQIIAEFNKQVKPIQEENARIAALDQVDKLRMESEKRQLAREEALQKQLQTIDSRVRTKSFNEIFSSGSVGQKIGAVFAVLAGGLSQGLSGAKSNPVLDFMNQLTEQQAQKDKLSQDEKEALRRQVFQQGEAEIKKLENATQNAYRKDQLAIMKQELAMKRQEVEARLQASIAAQQPADIFSGRELTKEEMMQVRANKDLRGNVVTMPNGKAYLASNPTDASEFKKLATESLNALSQLQKYRELGAKGSAFSLKDRAEADALRQAIVGALRLPFTGPGVLTNEERAQLIKTLGDPVALSTIRPIELAKIDQVIDSLKANTINRARLSGISGELFDDAKFYNIGGRAVREDKLVQAYKQKMPGLSEQQIKSAIRKQIPGL